MRSICARLELTPLAVLVHKDAKRCMRPTLRRARLVASSRAAGASSSVSSEGESQASTSAPTQWAHSIPAAEKVRQLCACSSRRVAFWSFVCCAFEALVWSMYLGVG